MPRWLLPYIFLIASSLVCVAVFTVTGPYNMRVDGEVYLSQIEQFERGTLVLWPHDIAFRAFKPFSGVFGSLLVPLLTPMQAMQLMNILFVFGLPFVCYKFLRELGFASSASVWGALWVVTAYPVLKYGLAISTDMGGWFFALLSASIGLAGLRTHSHRLLVLASFVGFLGGTIKETGVCGLIFLGMFVLFSSRTRSMRQTITTFLVLALPAIILELILFGLLLHAGFPSFLEWYSRNTGAYLTTQYTLYKFVGVQVSTFGILLLYAFLGLLCVLRKENDIRIIDLPTLAALIVASAPIFFWPIFISRIMFIQLLFIVPCALLGVAYAQKVVTARYKIHFLGPFLYAAPIVGALLLYMFVGNESLSVLLKMG